MRGKYCKALFQNQSQFYVLIHMLVTEILVCAGVLVYLRYLNEADRVPTCCECTPIPLAVHKSFLSNGKPHVDELRVGWLVEEILQ